MSQHERELLAKCITAQCAAMQTKRATVEMHTDAAEEAEVPAALVAVTLKV